MLFLALILTLLRADIIARAQYKIAAWNQQESDEEFDASEWVKERDRIYSHYEKKTGGITDEQCLLKKILNNYDRLSRPVHELATTVTIGISMTITKIFEFDEKNQVLIINTWIMYTWQDEYLQWQPENFSNLETIRIPSNRIWRPDIVLYNSAADFGTMAISTRALVSYNGQVLYRIPNKLFSSCKIDVTYFPFDEQLCHMKFGSWTYNGFQVDLVNASSTADLTFYIENGEWDLIYVLQKRNVVIYSCCIEPYPDVTFYFLIRRKALYYFINIFFPCFILSALTLLAFLLPVESCEKCGLGITIMLGFAVFMLTITQKLPETSESFPLISIYVAGVLTFTAISICCTVAILAVSYRTSRKLALPRRLNRFLDGVSSFICCKNYRRRRRCPKKTYYYTARLKPHQFLSELSAEISQLSNPYSWQSVELQNVDEFYRNLVIGINRLADRHCDQLARQAAIDEWRRLARHLDRILFALLLITIVYFSLYILVFAPSNKLL